ncbi:16S rRNA (uracil(1498)-N(3))-methyltransferase [Sedimenticola selenatireducens]|uniref:Ribosomal RNA small subunit methyltransferase E n=1 Tax=Sedimenticola selenatireducens TaxID=191960 RepID=A0A557SEI8_9GAMM|nr:16S rRNA (uracil(1498)-N(3))-methyltransferase [Sedimenticola selenatireducens]TVO75828.1 16S rRNA (uracil(1498)-N(3))-methyltransferase [Sedimenticola selenatireducens]TVT63687.1 MAG: 16S rRNA (uracil(1498)-N(3))-methyltransferase [Sedimenticola selenatireducens]
MNLLLITESDLVQPDRAIIRDSRLRHMLEVHRSKVGDQVRVGLLNEFMGSAVILSLSQSEAELQLTLTEQPPVPLPVTLVLALPRPKMLRRCLRMVAELGIKRLILLNSFRVEKSYWQTPLLSETQINEALIAGLEQVKDTRLPLVTLHKRFKPFVEDELPSLLKGQLGLVAHPYSVTDSPIVLPIDRPAVICIGPEGGFIPYEVDKLMQAGCLPLDLGDRIYRVETVLPLLAGRLYSS